MLDIESTIRVTLFPDVGHTRMVVLCFFALTILNMVVAHVWGHERVWGDVFSRGDKRRDSKSNCGENDVFLVAATTCPEPAVCLYPLE